MSQHVFTTTSKSNARVGVLIGWDRPLQQFFLVVEELDSPASEEGAYLYSNLSDQEARGCRDIGYFEGKLQELGIEVPAEMLLEVAADKANNVGNRYVNHTPSSSEGISTKA